jgi:pyruvate kinase
LADVIASVHPANLASARNLVHYLALRRCDLRPIQLRLARAGLSSLGRSESHVLHAIDAVINMLALARGEAPPTLSPGPVRFRAGQRRLAANARRLLGPHPRNRAVRIVVTLPTEAAEDERFARDLIAAGMDCARINCARDDAETWLAMAAHVRAGSSANQRECRILVDLGGTKFRTGAVDGARAVLPLSAGDYFELVQANADLSARPQNIPRMACNTPAVFQAAQTGEMIWFDDGVLGGVIDHKTRDGLIVRITNAPAGGSKLRPDRGINLPESTRTLPAVTSGDLRDLDAVIGFADAIDLSFVQSKHDVFALHKALRERAADHIGIVLKIETRQAFDQLPELLLANLQWESCGMMIARGDLAVEVGFERTAEIQEELLWIGEAAHTPTIWATKVLDNLAKKGELTRAEMTDAAMGARAEAVMLNKGAFLIDAIMTLDDILSRMKEHQSKKRPMFRALEVSRNLWP